MSKQISNLKKLRISVVIPAYNEEAYISACLEAIFQQTYAAFEIIVVDNHSSDLTSTIASTYKGVKVINEPTVGIFAAVSTGFNEATGDIIARTDADSCPDADWLENIASAFSDEYLTGLSGPIYYYDMPLAGLIKRGENFVRTQVANHSGSAKFLTGANMAIRRWAWLGVRDSICRMPGIHEDLDLAIHLQKQNQKIGFFQNVVVSTSARRLAVSFNDFYKYISGYESIYVDHGIQRSLIMKVPFFCYVPLQPVIKIIYKAYNARTRRVAWARLTALLQSY